MNLRNDVRESAEKVISDAITQPDTPTGAEDLESEVMDRLAPVITKYEKQECWEYAKGLASMFRDLDLSG